MRRSTIHVLCQVVLLAWSHSTGLAVSALKQLLASANTAEAQGDFDRALDLYEQALKLSPADQQAAISLKRLRFEAAQTHVNRGLELRRNGNLVGALAEFQKAVAIDSSSMVAAEEAAQTQRALDQTETADRSAPPSPALLAAPKLAPVRPLPDISIAAQPAPIIFQTLGKVAGIDVFVDQNATAGHNFSLHFSEKTLEQALDETAALTKWFWKPLSSTSIFVTMDNVQNRHDYEDQEMATFYLHNLTTPQELNEVANIIRTLLDIRRLLIYSAQSAIFIRGTADQIAAAAKLVDDMDKPKPEVVVDVVVMETSRTRSRQISTALSGSAALGIPVTFTPRTPTSSASGASSNVTSLSRLGHLSSGDFSVALPGLNLALDASDSQTRILQSPQVRASDGQKASLKIGQRVPFATGSFSSAVASVSGNPLVNTQLSYADIGVNVELTPHVHGRDELTLHIDIDISNVADHTDIGGVSEPVIGQRKVSHEVRLREGQATVLAGLAENEDSKLSTGLPGLFRVPLLRRLFGNDKSDRTLHDLLIVLIPHVVRAPEFTPSNLHPVFIGSDAVVHVKTKAKESSPPDPQKEPGQK